jgi:acyl-[acyl-carrier-protein]-phospholipid O-acyltransferase/long-chain-fatty-acid--[acyl-carrier-protein] ligase
MNERADHAAGGAPLRVLAGLMRSRRFAALFWCQFFSVFNDNFVRNMLAMLILFELGESHAGPLITLAIGTFVAPSLVLSGLGGELADAHDKAFVARALKLAEIFVQVIAAVGLVTSSLPALFLALLGLGVISAMFGPIKYGILPDLLRRDELVAGNALVEASTFIAIFLGLIAGGLSVAGDSRAGIVAQLMLVALACFAASLFIPATGRGAPGLRVNPNVLASTRDLFGEVRSTPGLWTKGLAVAWFWMSGAVALSLVPIVVRDKTGGGVEVETAVSALFALGIGIGSVTAAVIARGRIFLRPVPFAALGIAAFLIDLGLATWNLPRASEELGLAAFFGTPVGVRIACDVAALAYAGGVFVVPLSAAIQAEAAKDRRARVIGGVNIIVSSFIVAGVLATALLQSKSIGVPEPVLLAGLGVMNFGAAFYVYKKLLCEAG